MEGIAAQFTYARKEASYMVIIQNYTLEQRGDNQFSCKSCEKSYCPHCGGNFKVIGSRRRILYKQDGSGFLFMNL